MITRLIVALILIVAYVEFAIIFRIAQTANDRRRRKLSDLDVRAARERAVMTEREIDYQNDLSDVS